MVKPLLVFVLVLGAADARCAADDQKEIVSQHITQAIRPVMEHYEIPGMAVGLVIDGQNYIFNYGMASKETGKPVDNNTLFEIGSVTKTFTATITSYAQVDGHLSLGDKVSRYLPSLKDTRFGDVTLLALGTHTPGGLPLQVPNDVRNDDELMRYLRTWEPTYAPGSYRTYSNISIGLLGVIAAKSLNEKFADLMQRRLFPARGLQNIYVDLPATKMVHYAQGYTETDAPIRMAPGVLGDEAYGARTTAGDLLRFVQINMKTVQIDEKWQRAVTETHTGYYRIGAMTQDLVWEQYSCPVALKDLIAGNSAEISAKANPAVKIDPPTPPREDGVINKTGSTNGFSTYVVFVPSKRIGGVLLANKRYPNDARVTLARAILAGLTDQPPIN